MITGEAGAAALGGGGAGGCYASGADALRVRERVVFDRRSGAAAGGDQGAGADELPRGGSARLRDRGQWVRGRGRPLARRHRPHGPLVGLARALLARAAAPAASPRSSILSPLLPPHSFRSSYFSSSREYLFI